MEDGSTTGGQVIVKSELKPGYVLFEELPPVRLRAGLVLSASDIERIMQNPQIEQVRVMKIGEEEETVTSGHPHRFTKEDLKTHDLSPQEREKAIFDYETDSRLRQVIDIKKDIIRGEDYDQKVETHKQEKIKKFGDVLKSIHGHQKEQTLQVIDDYAKSAADLDGIVTVESLKTAELVKKLDRYERNAELFIQAALSQRKVFSSFVEEIVIDFINDVGYSLARALFSSVSKIDSFNDFLSAHSLQVMIVSLITAIEMTKMIKEKSDKLGSPDINTFLAISKKFFSLEELINLGVAALLHDIEIKNKMPHLSIVHKLGFEWDSLISLHPSNGFHLCKKLNIDFDIQRAVYQHHERFDGSGYPNGLMSRFFSKYTPIVMFAEYYIELTTLNPFVHKSIPPRIVLMETLSGKRKQFDGDVVYAFIKAASLFPVGSWLLLSDGHIGIVSGVNHNKLERPVMTVFFDKELKRIDPFDIDLANSRIEIIKPIDLPTIKRLAGDNLSFIFETDAFSSN